MKQQTSHASDTEISGSAILSAHRVADPAGCNACSTRYVGPLVGNGQISMFLDENGVMHDYDPLPGRGAPRIYWAGRRHGGDARAMAPFGYLTESPGWSWMESTAWEQALDVHGGKVVTRHQRGTASDVTTTAVLADRNVVAVHKKVNGLRGGPRTTFSFRLSGASSSQLPADFTILGGGQDESGCWLDYRLDGVVKFQGRIALWADRNCNARWTANELRIDIGLAATDEVTAYLCLADDVGDDPLYRASGWEGARFLKHPRIAKAIEHLQSTPITRDEPAKSVDSYRQWTSKLGWTGVEAHQRGEWDKWWAPAHIELPDAPDVQAIWETGLYATRTQLTRWSMPVLIHANYFNGQYFPDEFSAVKLLLVTGHHESLRRILDHKLSILPLGMQMTDGVGARGSEQPSYEGGYFRMWPGHTCLYEVYSVSFAPQYAWTWLKFAGMNRDDLRTYYPLFWGAAEYYRRFLVYRGPEGKLFTGACTDFDETHAGVVNGVGTTAAAMRSASLAADAAKVLGCDAPLIPQWEEVATGLTASIPTSSRGLIASYTGDEGVSMCAMRLLNTPFMRSPLTGSDERLVRTIHAWLTECKLLENWAVSKVKLAEGEEPASFDAQNPDSCSWTWLPAEMTGVLAVFGDARRAGEVVGELVRCRQNFCSLYEGKVTRDGFVSCPWFVSSSTELSASISLMLMIPHDDHIALFPATPDAWKNIRFTLWAMNRTRVSVEVRDGKLARLELHSPMVKKWAVRIPSRFDAGKILGTPSQKDETGEVYQVDVAP